jgi:hypothetical protein
MTMRNRLARLEAKGGHYSAEPILIMFRRVVDAAGDGGELHSAMMVGGIRYFREAGETEAEFEARAASLSQKVSNY